MIGHVVLGTNDLERSRAFYDALFTAMGKPVGETDWQGRPLYAHDGQRLIIGLPIDGKPATPSNGFTIGFPMPSAEMVKAWHDAGVANGGTSVEDPPGPRERPFGKVYLAYILDPDGNKLCGSCLLD